MRARPASGSDPVRLGILGAARITPLSIVLPARQVPEVELRAVAARDPARAEQFARRHSVPQVHASYAELLADPEIEAVYIPLPNSLHCAWAIAALEAGKHVLCEKPLAANADQAERIAAAGARTGRVLMEAMHYRYHPLAARVAELVRGGVVGAIQHVEARNSFPVPPGQDIRYRYELGGGALMDLGCYAVDFVRFIAGAEPQVVRAEARLASGEVDRWMRAELRFEDGRTARITCSMWSLDLPGGRARIEGDRGRMEVRNPYGPHLLQALTLYRDGQRQRRRLKGTRSTFHYQLRAFAAAIHDDRPIATDAANAIGTLRVIDAIYRQAGLALRGV